MFIDLRDRYGKVQVVFDPSKMTSADLHALAGTLRNEDVLRVIGQNRAWVKNYGVIAGLCRNPKTPPAISMQLVQRLNEKDIKSIATDRNAKEGLRLLAKKMNTKGKV